MTPEQDANNLLRALSARISVIEIALGAMAPTDPIATARLIRDFDSLADSLLAQFLAEDVDDTYISLVEKSIEDIRAYLGGPASDRKRN